MTDRILLPLDGSPLAEQALPVAATLARRLNADRILLCVVPDPLTSMAFADMPLLGDLYTTLLEGGRTQAEATLELEGQWQQSGGGSAAATPQARAPPSV